MKIILISLFTFLSFSALASDCKVLNDKTYFEDMEGEPIGNPKSKDYRIVYDKLTSFTPDPPIEASLNFPTTGDCSGLIFFKVEIYRALGPDKFPGGEGHEGHSDQSVKLVWDKKPIYSGKKDLSFKKDTAVLKSFNIQKMMEKA
ncbi:MAG: hypothetical protein ACJARO_002081, partial [Bacteriovoracaceae bacterium]